MISAGMIILGKTNMSVSSLSFSYGMMVIDMIKKEFGGYK